MPSTSTSYLQAPLLAQARFEVYIYMCISAYSIIKRHKWISTLNDVKLYIWIISSANLDRSAVITAALVTIILQISHQFPVHSAQSVRFANCTTYVLYSVYTNTTKSSPHSPHSTCSGSPPQCCLVLHGLHIHKWQHTLLCTQIT